MTNVLTKDVKIDVHHITRVEGHGNLVVDVQNGELKQCDLQIIEAPRYFEAMLLGQPYHQTSHLTSRICGICAVTHATASVLAVEHALGVVNTPQTVLLRKLQMHAEMLDSHVLHAYMLVAPDFLGVGSVIPLAGSHPEVVLRALRMKKLAGDICAAIAGRHTHPISMAVGGFTHFPSIEELKALRQRLDAVREDVEATVVLYENLPMPAFERDTEFMALTAEDEYCFIGNTIASSEGGTWPIEAYRRVTNEHIVTHSTAKHAYNQRETYMVGSLARFNLNHDKLHPRALAAAEALKLKPGCINPYMNTTAQVVEIAHCVEDSIAIIDQLLADGIQWEELVTLPRNSGDGVGACEAPRGTLYHHYEVTDGLVSGANCIIPTGQNLANIEADMRALVPTVIGKTQDEITLALEMLVRAYDPCISCSTHMLEVKYV